MTFLEVFGGGNLLATARSFAAWFPAVSSVNY